MRFSHFLITIGGLALTCAATWAQTRSLYLMGTYAPGYASYVTGLSGDGSVAVGGSTATLPNPNTRGFRWTLPTGRVDIPGPPVITQAINISPEGGVVVGQFGALSATTAFRRIGDGPLEGLGILTGYTSSRAYAASTNGSVIVGKNIRGNGSEGQAFRWTASAGLQGLGYLQANGIYSDAAGVSWDGTVIAGISRASGSGDPRAFVWRETTGLQELPGLPGSTSTYATGISGNGRVVLGSVVTENNTTTVGVCWFDGQVVNLGTTPSLLSPVAFASNYTGSVIVGTGNHITGNGDDQTFIWREEEGMMFLSQYLRENGVPLPADAAIGACTCVSADGMTFGGTLLSPTLGTQGFVATIPQPAVSLLPLAYGMRLMRRRGRRGSVRHPSLETASCRTAKRQRSMKSLPLSVAMGWGLLLSAPAAAQTPSLSLMGSPANGYTSRVYGMSADGSVAVGFSDPNSPFLNVPGFRWARNTGRVDILNPPSVIAPVTVSSDGMVLAGFYGTRTVPIAFRRVGTGPLESLGIQSGYASSSASAMSSDGSVIVGQSSRGNGSEAQAFRWTPATGLQGLGYLRPNGIYSDAVGVSWDGTVISGNTRSIGTTFYSEAFVWSQATGMQALSRFPGSTSSDVGGMSGDGRVVFGSVTTENNTNSVGVAWFDGQIANLGSTPGLLYPHAFASNYTGSVIVGTGNRITGNGEDQTFIWREEEGMMFLSQFLRENGVPLPADAAIGACAAVSADGKTFGGFLLSPSLGDQGFVATIPQPAFSLLPMAYAMRLMRRRRGS